MLQPVPAVGDVTAGTLVAQLPELGIIGRDRLAALIAMVPIKAAT